MEYNPLHWAAQLTATFVNTDSSDKIILPPSVLETLINQSQAEGINLPSPLIFKITNPRNEKYTHVGVREFSAEELSALLPNHVVKQLEVGPSDPVYVQFMDLPKGSSLTIKPLGTSYDIEDWKVFLEAKLRSAFTALTKGNVLSISHSGQNYDFLVEKLEPEDAVCIVDTDIDLEILPDIQSQKVARPNMPVEVSVGKPLKIQDLQPTETLKLDLKEWNRDISLNIRLSEESTEGVRVFVGTDAASTNPNSFLWSSLSQDPLSISPNDPFLGNQLFIVVTCQEPSTFIISIDQATSNLQENTPPADTIECANCHQQIPKQSFQLHTTFCERNNVACPQGCGKVFPRRQGIPPNHWHCEHGDAWGDSELSAAQHQASVHVPAKCECGEEFPNFIAIAQHRATVCPQKLHICRFCHLLLPQEQALPADMLQGLSGHESYCGNKTADCDVCKRAVRLKEMEIHMKFHNQQRVKRSIPEVCSNQNCSRLAENNNLKMCGICYGPLHSTLYDPTGSKLRSRIERRYVIQLSRGCQKPWCMNRYCVTGNPGVKRPMAEIMVLVRELMDESGFRFCVEESATKRRLFIDYQTSIGEYAAGWCAQAINEAKGNEQEAQRWLKRNAPKMIEQQ